jgi:hypothetical protein
MLEKRSIELAKQALMEKQTRLAHEMAECNEAYEALDRLLDAEIEKSHQPLAGAH